MTSIQANGLSALMYASSIGHPETVKLLLERGATVDLTDKEVETVRTRLKGLAQTG